MWSYLKALAARLAAKGFRRLPPDAPEDPYAGVLEPIQRRPGGKNDAVALAEPGASISVRADGDAQRRGGSSADLGR